MGKYLILAGVALLIAGGVLMLIERVGVRPGQLPGDISFSRGNWTFAFPIVTCIIVSVVLTIVLNLLSRLGK